MKKLDLYEQVGIVIPGAVLLFGLVFLVPELRELLAKDGITVGGFGMFLTVAYAAGHLLASIGASIAYAWWSLFSGMPSDWVIKAKQDLLTDAQLDQLTARIEQRLGLQVGRITGLSKANWGSVFQELYRDVLINSPGRIKAFNANYGMARALVGAAFVLAVVTLVLKPDWWLGALCLIGAAILFLHRMHRAGINFAREAFRCFLLLGPEPGSKRRKSRKPKSVPADDAGLVAKMS